MPTRGVGEFGVAWEVVREVAGRIGVSLRRLKMCKSEWASLTTVQGEDVDVIVSRLAGSQFPAEDVGGFIDDGDDLGRTLEGFSLEDLLPFCDEFGHF